MRTINPPAPASAETPSPSPKDLSLRDALRGANEEGRDLSDEKILEKLLALNLEEASALLQSSVFAVIARRRRRQSNLLMGWETASLRSQ
jgi:hypothetical protein